MSNKDLITENQETTDFHKSSDQNEASFTIDEPYDESAASEGHASDHDAQPSGKTDGHSLSTAVDSSERKKDVYQPRRQTPSHILFLPNMASRTSEKELAEFAEQLPRKVKKTFMYMSDVAYHGFVECESVEDAIKNLDFINSNTLEVRGKRVLAEFSRRKSVQDRKTYENRQHVRKDRDSSYDRRTREPRRPSPPPRRRSRSRSPPRGYRPRSPPRPMPRGRYPPPRDYRDEPYRREGPPPPSDYRYPPRPYDDRAPAPYRRDYERDREYRGSDYDRYEAYPPRGAYPPESYRSGPPPAAMKPYREAPRESYPPPVQREAPVAPYPREAYAPPVGPSEPYHQQAYQQPQTYGSAAVSHPLLSMRPTTIGTAPAYQYHQYR